MEDVNHPVQFIQCKRVDTDQAAKAMIKKFKKNPPMPTGPHWNLVLEIHVKGSREVYSVSL
jgi:hypothetical protein